MVLRTVPAREPSPEVGLRSLDRARKRGATPETCHHHHQRPCIAHHHPHLPSMAETPLFLPCTTQGRERRGGRGHRAGAPRRGTRDRLQLLPGPSEERRGPHLPGRRSLPSPPGEEGCRSHGDGGAPGPPLPGTKGPSISRAAEHNKGAWRPREPGRGEAKRGMGITGRAGTAAGAGATPPQPTTSGGSGVDRPAGSRAPRPRSPLPRRPQHRAAGCGFPAAGAALVPPGARAPAWLSSLTHTHTHTPRRGGEGAVGGQGTEEGKGKGKRRPDLAELLAVLGGRLHGRLAALPQPRLQLQQPLPQAPQLQEVAAGAAALPLGLLVRHLRTPLRRVRSPPAPLSSLPASPGSPRSAPGHVITQCHVPGTGGHVRRRWRRAGARGARARAPHAVPPRRKGLGPGRGRGLRASRDATPRAPGRAPARPRDRALPRPRGDAFWRQSGRKWRQPRGRWGRVVSVRFGR